jgi:hypothetical protein
MTEGTFPKVDGDILYASEINTIYPKVIGNIAQFVEAGTSGTNYAQWGGSIVYLGSGLSRLFNFMEAKVSISNNDANAATDYYARMRISGAGLNIATDIKTFKCSTGLVIDHIYTSGAITASGGNIGSSYSITTECNSSAAGGANLAVGDFVVVAY